ncbi:hypothetical protein SDC9_114308 [bioreactor metagenome]|uniref:Uncharacterized protein n=1 Tax=bioreactor metagenome TaxID=1076179 RepID=A0A645BPS7_9ZZZZ
MARQRVGGAHPHRLELFGLVRHRLLIERHASDQEGYGKPLGRGAVGRPVRQHMHVAHRQPQTARGALRHEGLLAVDGGDVGRIREAAIVGMAGQQQA